MQIHLKGLTKAEFRGLMSVVNWQLKNMGEPKDFGEFQQWDALRDLLMEMMRRVPEMKDKMNLTLKGEAATALYRQVDIVLLPAYEGAVMWQVMSNIDRQWQGRMTMLKGNMTAGGLKQEGGEI